MRVQRPVRLALSLLAVAGTALAITASTDVSAQRMNSSRMFAPRMNVAPGNSGYYANKAVANPRYPKAPGKVVVTNPPGRYPPTGPGGATNPTRPDRHPPTGPGPRRPGGGWGPIVGGGIVIGTLGPALANPPPPPPSFGSSGGPQGPRGAGVNIPPQNEQRFVPNEVVLEFPGNLTPQAIGELATRHRLAQIETLRFSLTNSIFFRGRITDGRPVRDVLRGLNNEPALRSGVLLAGQPNYIYRSLQAQGSAPSSGPDAGGARFTPPPSTMPTATPVAATAAAAAAAAAMQAAQYTIGKLRLPEAHGLARGSDVVVAVIDSGIDVGHPELAGVVTGAFDALGTKEKPHFHGTAIAGAIASRAKLMGVAPAARILAIQAFGAVGTTAEATSMAILKSIEYATLRNARVINMSFAGPTADPGLARHLSAARLNGAVLIAAAGNFGPKSPPQYPAADPNVIAVTATDADDKLFKASNIGPHVAIAAPGVDILLPEPEGNYQLRSGTSFAAAHVSGIAALILERKPGLSPDIVRQILLATARDLGTPGRDPQYGAGLADAYQAILAIERAAAVPAPPAASMRPSSAAR